MKHSRRLFFKQGLAGALLLGTSAIAKAGLPDPVKPKAPKAVNPFHLGGPWNNCNDTGFHRC